MRKRNLSKKIETIVAEWYQGDLKLERAAKRGLGQYASRGLCEPQDERRQDDLFSVPYNQYRQFWM